jgi:hypothetical protein
MILRRYQVNIFFIFPNFFVFLTLYVILNDIYLNILVVNIKEDTLIVHLGTESVDPLGVSAAKQRKRLGVLAGFHEGDEPLGIIKKKRAIEVPKKTVPVLPGKFVFFFIYRFVFYFRTFEFYSSLLFIPSFVYINTFNSSVYNLLIDPNSQSFFHMKKIILVVFQEYQPFHSYAPTHDSSIAGLSMPESVYVYHTAQSLKTTSRSGKGTGPENNEKGDHADDDDDDDELDEEEARDVLKKAGIDGVDGILEMWKGGKSAEQLAFEELVSRAVGSEAPKNPGIIIIIIIIYPSKRIFLIRVHSFGF